MSLHWLASDLPALWKITINGIFMERSWYSLWWCRPGKSSFTASINTCGDLKDSNGELQLQEQATAKKTNCWIDLFLNEKKNIEFFAQWQPYQFPRLRLSLPKRKKTLVLDLDETLVHSTLKKSVNPNIHPSFLHKKRLKLFSLEVIIGNQVVHYQVSKRPHVEYFLQKVPLLFLYRCNSHAKGIHLV